VEIGGGWEGVIELTRTILGFIAVKKPRANCEKAVKASLTFPWGE
jgi:hypothetical protein